MPPFKPSIFERIACAIASARRQQQDRRQMMAMSEAELRDLGIGRGQIPDLLGTMPARGAPWQKGLRPEA